MSDADRLFAGQRLKQQLRRDFGRDWESYLVLRYFRWNRFERIKESQKTKARYHVTGAHEFLDLQVQATTEYYLEEGELAMPPKFNQTAEERKAGF